MKIIEFCGAPGCGKSTLCDKIEVELKGKGYKVINLQKKPKAISLIQKIKKVLITHLKQIMYSKAPSNRLINNLLNEIIGEHKDIAVRFWANRILEAVFLIEKAYLKKYDIALFDEGCVQFLTSMAHTEGLNEKYISLLHLLLEKVYCDEYIFFCADFA